MPNHVILLTSLMKSGIQNLSMLTKTIPRKANILLIKNYSFMKTLIYMFLILAQKDLKENIQINGLSIHMIFSYLIKDIIY
jgi:hypothetical protein